MKLICVTFTSISILLLFHYAQSQECSDLEEYSECDFRCSKTCGGVPCRTGCESGCFCKSGYKRHPNTGVCIPESYCLGYCPQNEENRESDDRCAEKCPNQEDLFCVKNATSYSECFCNEGYKRNDQGVCVIEAECTDVSSKCGKNEEFSSGNKCHEKCNRKNLECNRNLFLDCHCIKGYLRHPKTDTCIPKSECP